MAREIKRKADTGEAGNPGQFGRIHRGEAYLDLSALSDEQLAGVIEEMDLEDDLSFDLDGDGKPDGELDIVREGTTVRLTGTITQNGVARQVDEEVGEVSSIEQLRAELIAAAQRIAQG